jgi:hypothetical protein
VRREDPRMYPSNLGSRDGVGITRTDVHGNDDALHILQHLFSTTYENMKLCSEAPHSLEDVWLNS